MQESVSFCLFIEILLLPALQKYAQYDINEITTKQLHIILHFLLYLTSFPHMHSHMFLPRSIIVETSLTNQTFKRGFAPMNSLMNNKRSFYSKILRAKATLVRPLLRVLRLHVNFQMRRLFESLIARLTNIRFFPRVSKSMNAQRGKLPETFLAIVTLERLFVRVKPVVDLQRHFRAETLAALVAEEPPFAMRPLVRFQGLFRLEISVADRTFVAPLAFLVVFGRIMTVLDVSLQLTHLFVRVAAGAADERFFPGVRPHVGFQGVVLHETLLADFADVRLLARVDHVVSLQVRLACKPRGALLAFEWSLFRVRSYVVVQVVAGVEVFAAHRTGEVPRSGVFHDFSVFLVFGEVFEIQIAEVAVGFAWSLRSDPLFSNRRSDAGFWQILFPFIAAFWWIGAIVSNFFAVGCCYLNFYFNRIFVFRAF